MNKKAVILLSGGLDSATVLAIAKEAGYELYALSFRYGQRNYPELKAAKRLAKEADVKQHLIMQIDMGLIGGSALTEDIPVPKAGEKADSDIPVTYVPARNTIFLSFALGWAEVVKAYDIFIGVNALDYSGYPDCRPEFIQAYEKMANLATKAGVEGRKFSVHTPLIDLTKAQIIKKGVALGVDYGKTHTCYDPTSEGLACGKCDSCILRKKGFTEAGVEDPTRYA
ncbi:MAG: 7-cyano-7-deazaguanine synthase QueC [Candidatus Rifleibacteriota bacterium]